LSRQWWFLPKMGKGRRHQQPVTRLAQAQLAMAALHPAVSWAQRTGAHKLLQCGNTPVQLAGSIEENIRRVK